MNPKERSQFLSTLLKKVTKTTNKIYKYQSTPRVYGTDEPLYMREAHFIEVLGNGELEMGQISEKLDVTNGAASQIASRLEKKGYIIRKKNPSDSRHITCILTDKAHLILSHHNKMDTAAHQEFEHMMSGFSVEELSICNQFLAIINRLYDMESPDHL